MRVINNYTKWNCRLDLFCLHSHATFNSTSAVRIRVMPLRARRSYCRINKSVRDDHFVSGNAGNFCPPRMSLSCLRYALLVSPSHNPSPINYLSSILPARKPIGADGGYYRRGSRSGLLLFFLLLQINRPTAVNS